MQGGARRIPGGAVQTAQSWWRPAALLALLVVRDSVWRCYLPRCSSLCLRPRFTPLNGPQSEAPDLHVYVCASECALFTWLHIKNSEAAWELFGERGQRRRGGWGGWGVQLYLEECWQSVGGAEIITPAHPHAHSRGIYLFIEWNELSGALVCY